MTHVLRFPEKLRNDWKNSAAKYCGWATVLADVGLICYGHYNDVPAVKAVMLGSVLGSAVGWAAASVLKGTFRQGSACVLGFTGAIGAAFMAFDSVEYDNVTSAQPLKDAAQKFLATCPAPSHTYAITRTGVKNGSIYVGHRQSESTFTMDFGNDVRGSANGTSLNVPSSFSYKIVGNVGIPDYWTGKRRYVPRQIQQNWDDEPTDPSRSFSCPVRLSVKLG